MRSHFLISARKAFCLRHFSSSGEVYHGRGRSLGVAELLRCLYGAPFLPVSSLGEWAGDWTEWGDRLLPIQHNVRNLWQIISIWGSTFPLDIPQQGSAGHLTGVPAVVGWGSILLIPQRRLCGRRASRFHNMSSQSQCVEWPKEQCWQIPYNLLTPYRGLRVSFMNCNQNRHHHNVILTLILMPHSAWSRKASRTPCRGDFSLSNAFPARHSFHHSQCQKPQSRRHCSVRRSVHPRLQSNIASLWILETRSLTAKWQNRGDEQEPPATTSPAKL